MPQTQSPADWPRRAVMMTLVPLAVVGMAALFVLSFIGSREVVGYLVGRDYVPTDVQPVAQEPVPTITDQTSTAAVEPQVAPEQRIEQTQAQATETPVPAPEEPASAKVESAPAATSETIARNQAPNNDDPRVIFADDILPPDQDAELPEWNVVLEADPRPQPARVDRTAALTDRAETRRDVDPVVGIQTAVTPTETEPVEAPLAETPIEVATAEPEVELDVEPVTQGSPEPQTAAENLQVAVAETDEEPIIRRDHDNAAEDHETTDQVARTSEPESVTIEPAAATPSTAPVQNLTSGEPATTTPEIALTAPETPLTAPETPLTAPETPLTAPVAPQAPVRTEDALVSTPETPAAPAQESEPEPVTVAVAEPQAPATAEPEIPVAQLIGQGQSLMSTGDVVQARQLFTKSLSTGSPEAALALGRSFDPKYLARVPRANAKPDPVMARKWYEEWYRRSVDQGSISPNVRLERLLQAMSLN